ncbi:isochorismatase family protein [Defluviimonas sp. WL0002]|uniref:Isochorismatase family protein n=1 Tax=Albidovulum marisflavi TaxID=2984159 RepID=A0ABT2Z9D9_9RHOB|nr:isochorismatase family protein [Defluviimonas sp. WL0002]MCV2867693.1 isochorismatase family protein [Defluviimonas sp. WL0002]
MNEPLFSRDTSVLAVIDVQSVFLDKLPEAERTPLVGRICWLVRAADALGVPIIAMAEDIAANGPPVPPITAALPEGTLVHDKRVFGLAGQPDILADLTSRGRGDVVLAGLETDVCVAQSALGLIGAGFRVAALSDATGSPGACHAAGLERMRGGGVHISTVKGIYYEWVRDLETLARVKAQIGTTLPAGLTL